MGYTQAMKPLTDILKSDEFIIRAEPLKAGTYNQGDILTYDGEYFSKANLESGDNHTEAFAIVYEGDTIAEDGGKIAIILAGAVDGNLLSTDYQALSDDDKKVVNKELASKNIIVE